MLCDNYGESVKENKRCKGCYTHLDKNLHFDRPNFSRKKLNRHITKRFFKRF